MSDQPPPGTPPTPPPAPPPPGGTPPGGGFSGPQGGGVGPGGGAGIGDAFNYGWTKFQSNIGAIILGLLVYFAIAVVIGFIWFIFVGVIGAGFGDTDAGLAAFLFTTALFALVAVFINVMIQAGVTRAALAITYGEPIEMKTLLATDSLPQVAVGSLIIAVASFIGFILCYVPGLIVLFFSQFFVHFVLDKRLSSVDAIKASVSFVNRNLATLIGFFIASMIAYAVGAVLCGIGIIVALPVVVIAQAFMYRRLQGEPVAA